MLSESEAESRLHELRDHRDRLDREIADLALYLELGRRLGPGPGPGAGANGTEFGSVPAVPSLRDEARGGPTAAPFERADSERMTSRMPDAPAPASYGRAGTGAPHAFAPVRADQSGQHRLDAYGDAPAGRGPAAHGYAHHGRAAHDLAAERERAARPVPGMGEEVSGEEVLGLSETVLARRHGRALIEAALTALEEAGRPLHASEILGVLSARGFALPGHDPVAALNTRLWKRSGAGGPLRRLGDAVYALAEGDPALED